MSESGFEESRSPLEALEIMIRNSSGLPTQNLVMSEIIAISNEIPDNVNQLTALQAEHLAGRFLKGFELCGDLYAMAIGHEIKMESLKKKEFGTALLVRSKAQGHKTAADKTAYAQMDDTYLAAEQKYNEAKMFRVMVSQKHQTFEKAHYHMRKLADRDANMAAGRPSFSSEESDLKDWP